MTGSRRPNGDANPRERPPMNDVERLHDIQSHLRDLSGVDARTYRRFIRAIEQQASEAEGASRGATPVAFFDARPYDRAAFEQVNDDRCSFEFLNFRLSRETAPAASGSRVACVFVNDSCDADAGRALAAEGIELIALRCAGYNNVDLDACRENDIGVVRVPAYSPHAVAEHTIALMLMLNRNLHHAYNRNRAGQFVLDGLTGFDMQGKTVGVVGTGAIGRALIDILLGFGCEVLACDKFPHPELAQRAHVRYVELDELLREAHIISLHVPLFEETYHLINEAAFEKMRDGVMFINTSRGGLVDTPQLVAALKSGKVGAAGLDVYEEEQGVFWTDKSLVPLTDDVLSRLLSFPNVVVTSHQAFLTQEALHNIAETTLENIAAFVNGKRGSSLPNNVLA